MMPIALTWWTKFQITTYDERRNNGVPQKLQRTKNEREAVEMGEIML